MKAREVRNKSKDVPPSQASSHQQEETYADFHRPEAHQHHSLREAQKLFDRSEAHRRKSLREAQKLFDRGASRSSQPESSRTAEKRHPSVTETLSAEEFKARQTAGVERINQMFGQNSRDED